MNNEELVMDVTEELIDIPVEVDDSTDLINVDDIQDKTEIGGAEVAIIAAAAAGVVATGVVLVKGGKKVVNFIKGKIEAKKANKKLAEEEGDLEEIDILEEEVEEEANNKGKKRK